MSYVITIFLLLPFTITIPIITIITVITIIIIIIIIVPTLT